MTSKQMFPKFQTRFGRVIATAMLVLLTSLTVMFTVFTIKGVGGQSARTCAVEGFKGLMAFAVLLAVTKLRGGRGNGWWR